MTGDKTASFLPLFATFSLKEKKFTKLSGNLKARAFKKRKAPYFQGAFGIKTMTERVSRVLSRTIIYLRLALPQALPAKAGCRRAHKLSLRPGRPSARGVASDRVYMAPAVTCGSVSSYLAFPSLPYVVTAVYFCCTFPEVTFGGRYPLSCPTKPGLSSR